MEWYGVVYMVTWTARVSVSVAPSYFSGAPTSRACSALSAIAHDFSRLLVDPSVFSVFTQLGDVFADRYIVVKKLGWGHFSTVWMARDDRRTSSTAPKVTHVTRSRSPFAGEKNTFSGVPATACFQDSA